MVVAARWRFLIGKSADELVIGASSVERSADKQLLRLLVVPVALDGKLAQCLVVFHRHSLRTQSPALRRYRRYFSSTFLVAARSMGLAMWAFMPQVRQRCTSSENASALIAMIGTVAASLRSRARIAFVAS